MQNSLRAGRNYVGGVSDIREIPTTTILKYSR
jgi:hypothetical protein